MIQGEIKNRDIEKDWEFWGPLVAPDGVIDIEKVKAELSDFSMVMEGLPELFMHVTAGRCSKIETFKSIVMSLHDESVNEIVEREIETVLAHPQDYIEGGWTIVPIALTPEIKQALYDHIWRDVSGCPMGASSAWSKALEVAPKYGENQ